LRAVAGFLRLSSGRLHFEGAEEPALAIHYLGHQNGLKGTASAHAHVRQWAGLLGGNAGDALAGVGLERQAELPARALSQGQQRRLGLARLLVAPRPLWLLDEPAAGLDEAGRGRLAHLINAHMSAGGSVLAALHEALAVSPGQTLTLGAPA
jgi:heme exporter protein A